MENAVSVVRSDSGCPRLRWYPQLNSSWLPVLRRMWAGTPARGMVLVEAILEASSSSSKEYIVNIDVEALEFLLAFIFLYFLFKKVSVGVARTYNRNSKPWFGFCRYQCMATLWKLSTKTLQDISAVSSLALDIDISGCSNFPRPTASKRETYPWIISRGRNTSLVWLPSLLHMDLTGATHRSRGMKIWLLSGVDSHLPGWLSRKDVKERGLVTQGSSWSAVVMSGSEFPGQHKLVRSVRKLWLFFSGGAAWVQSPHLFLFHCSLQRGCSEYAMKTHLLYSFHV